MTKSPADISAQRYRQELCVGWRLGPAVKVSGKMGWYTAGIGAVFIIYFRIMLIRFFFRLKEARWKSGIEWFFLNQTENNKLN